MLAELGVRKCEPLDVVIAKTKRRRLTRHSRASPDSGETDDASYSSGAGEDEGSNDDLDASAGDEEQRPKITPWSPEQDGDYQPAKKRQRSSPIDAITSVGDQDLHDGPGHEPNGALNGNKTNSSSTSPDSEPGAVRRSERKRKPLFELDQLP